MKPKLLLVCLIAVIFGTNVANAQTVSDNDDARQDTAVVPIMMKTVPSPFELEYSGTDLKNKVENGQVKEKVKTYSKVYPAASNDELKIENSFGEVVVNTWDRKEFKIDVQIKVYANVDADADKFLDVIQISDSKVAGLALFKTVIGDDGSMSPELWKGEGKNHIKKIEINYVVYMPVKNTLSINNKYGNTTLPDLQGKVTIHSFYGSLKAKSLLNPLCEIKVHFGDVNIGTLTGGNLQITYGSLNLAESDKLNADISFGPAKIGTLHTSGNIRVKYCGKLQIATLDKNLKMLDINSSYSNVKLDINNNENANFDISTYYGSFNYDKDRASISNKTPGSDTYNSNAQKSYVGQLGKGSPDKTITIRSNFGRVDFN
ncbi:hypothetical protein SAMN05421821_10868 [Mucilaginibacter lappiensis]|uniref:Adhesin n=1 Tax=Mucilaginibacter lappiensis TaxID=354630 RepID=A0ABR6PK70_9SPHI|nr:DUF4097 family beta strand repeat-containing protein [Mucilaginibacter lappiensis]MBB6110125.1 hypothetical protein [Mucilaginibacter lappiensis]SIR52358.1 hypothetical protein SAMN05421821_10868 [Mucilaginibacter lappiensis]